MTTEKKTNENQSNPQEHADAQTESVTLTPEEKKQELLYDCIAAPALWYNMLFLNHIRNSIAGELDIKPLTSNYDLNEKKERLDQYDLALYNLRIQYREI